MTDSASPEGGVPIDHWGSWELARRHVEEAVREAKEIAKDVRAGSDFKALDGAIAALGDNIFRIGATGDFSTGKSTLINAMLGEELLPAGVQPMTARLAEIRHGAFPRIVLTLTDGTSVDVSTEEFLARTERLKAAEDACEPAEDAADYLKATFQVSKPIAGAGVAYVDVPGYLSEFKTHETIADDAMRSCDALIAVLHADAVLRSVESDRLAYALTELQHRSVFVAVNKVGLLRDDQREELISGFWPRWERFLATLDLADDVVATMRRRVYFIDSYNTLQNRLGHEGSFVGVTEFAQLEQDLASLASGDVITKKLARPRKILLRRLTDLRTTVVNQNMLLDVDAADLAGKRDSIETSIRKLEKLADEIQALVEDRGPRASIESTVRDLAERQFSWCLNRLTDWAQSKRGTRAPQQGNRLTRLGAGRTRERIRLIAGELTGRLGRESVDWSDREVFPAIREQLRRLSELARPDLEAFEHEINNTWRELLSATTKDVPNFNVVDTAIEELLDLRPDQLPLNIRPAGLVRLVMGDVSLRLKGIFAELRSANDPDELVAALMRVVGEIGTGLSELRNTVVGTDAQTRDALDRILEGYACRIVARAVRQPGADGVTLTQRYASNAGTIFATRTRALDEYLKDQGARVSTLYRNTVATLDGGMARISGERAALAAADTRLAAMIAAGEGDT